MNLSFTIPGAPRTKKNHGRVVKRGNRKFHVPSEAFETWNSEAQFHLMRVRTSRGGRAWIANHGADNVNCHATFFRDANRGDAVGYYQALADALQESGILQNDAQIVSWDGSRLMKSAEPRIEVLLEVLA